MAFLRSPCLHTAAAPCLPSSDRDPSVHHIQTPAPTLASLSLAQRIASLLAAVSSLSMTVLTAGSSSGLRQCMDSASWPRSCSFGITLHIGAPDVGWSCTAFSLEPSHGLASLAVNRCCLASRATGPGVSPANRQCNRLQLDAKLNPTKSAPYVHSTEALSSRYPASCAIDLLNPVVAPIRQCSYATRPSRPP